ncbi:MAG: RluA family pseudouridine synthase [Planctomycetota bacterium]|nr:MAG: RluA family pseudouridine synthase [Planctomycetota bacterium]
MDEPAILHADNHVLALAKPAGLPVVPDASGDASLLDWAKAWVKREHAKPGAVYLGVVHRLDRPVSGVVVFARTSKAAERLSAQFRERGVEKVYLGVVERRPASDAGRVEQWLDKDESRNVVRAYAAPRAGALHALTEWRWLRGDGPALLELAPETGRPHQLRSACRALACPLLGDLKYGAKEPLADASIALHARRLAFDHPTRRERVVLEVEPPQRAWWTLARR